VRIPLQIACLSALSLLPGFAAAAGDGSFCKTPMTSDSYFRSDASVDLYNSLLWMGGAAALSFGVHPSSRWSDTNSFDREISDGLRADSASAREDAALASDVLLAFTAGAMPLAAIAQPLFDGDCEEAYDMATDALESVSLTLFVTEAVKVIAGRDRPFVESCDSNPPRDAECGKRDRFESFFSGHASVAGAGAGVSCAFAIRRQTWGESKTAQVVPCLLGASAAVTTGVLRIVADRHWGTDVLVGLGVGATIGYLDTWGPFDHLRFEMESDDHAWQVRGMVLPYAADGALGARVALTF
jgi:membrane-associated phospholipid phosphatase